MFENEFYINIEYDDAIIFDKFFYLAKIYQHYWNYTYNSIFLYKYKNALKEAYKNADFIKQKYLKNYTFQKFSVDLANLMIICQK